MTAPWSNERRLWWIRDYWFYLVLATLTLVLVLARLAGAWVSWWWVVAPVGLILLTWIGVWIGLRIDHERRTRRTPEI